jgi:DNA-directed RNA polymerase II subunit RPB2
MLAFEDTKALMRGALAATTLVDHHIDSYDDFLDTLLPAIVAEPPHRVTEARGQLHHFQFGRVSYMPAVVMEADGVLREVTPEECRVRALDYTVTVLTEVTHSVHAKPRRQERPDDVGPLLSRDVYHDVKLCQLPLMVGSRRCVTRRTGDSPETGGFFVVRGNDKAVIPQEKMRINVPCVFRAVGHGGKYQLTCEVRSWTEAKIRTTSTLNMYATHDTGGQTPTVHVTIPYSKHGVVPLRVMFMLLGCSDVGVMRQCVLGDAESFASPGGSRDSVGAEGFGNSIGPIAAELAKRVDAVLEGVPPNVAQLSPTGLLRWVVTRSTDAAPRSARLTEAMAEVAGLVDKEVLPHLATPVHKWYYLGMMARKLLHVQVSKNPQFRDAPGRRRKDDRDDFCFKAVETTGMLMALLFRRHFRAFKDKLARQYKATAEKKVVMLNDLIGLYADITQSFRTAFTTGMWQVKPQKAGGSSQGNGVVQMMSRINVVAALGHLQKVNAPLNKDGKMAKPRLLHGSHYGRFCPCDTPEGAACGLNKHLALLARVRIGYPAEAVMEPLRRLPGFTPFTSAADLAPGRSPLYVNGILVGLVTDAAWSVTELRRWRRRGDLACDVTVYHDAEQREVHVNSDSGVVLWPVLVVERLAATRDAIRRVPPSQLWGHLLALGCVEYVDTLEEANLLVAEDAAALGEASGAAGAAGDSGARQYSHVALHGSLMLGARAALIPFSNLNQSPRNVYAAGMVKQAISVAQETPAPRFDTLSYTLDTIQRPLVTTLAADVLAPDHSNIGQNVVCAIMCSGGYNQEDSVIVNKSAIERGLLRVTACRTYREHEKASSNDVTAFERPRPGECLNTRHADYSAIEEDGLPVPGGRLTPECIVIGKTVTSSPLGEVNSRAKTKKHVTRDQSVPVRHNEAMVVDRVAVATSEEGTQLVRVQLRCTRVPEVGDKLSSRHSQKGVIGAVVPQEDMPFNPATGMVPDIIINPHCMPSRMSIGHLMEALAAKVAAAEGAPVDGTPFETPDDLAALLGQRLLAQGHAASGMERLCDGTTGELLDAAVFVCPTYYLRLKHMVADKLHARARGPMQILTRQPAGGRSKDGGLRIGEMERDCIIAHGAAHFMRDRLFHASDGYTAHVCGRCGGLAEDACTDRAAIQQTSLQLVGGGKYCRACRSSDHVRPVEMSYAFKLLLQELHAMHVGTRITTM